MDLYMFIVSPPARAAYVTAKHLGLDFNVKTVNLLKGEHHTPEYLKMNPSHTIPTLNDNGFFLFESRAIMTYFVNQYRPDSTLYPKDTKKRAEVDKVLYFDASAVFNTMVIVLKSKFLRNEDPTPEVLDTLTERVSILEQLLGEKQFFAGDQVTLADISLGTCLQMLITRKVVTSLAVPPTLVAWYERVLEAIPELRQANLESIEAIKKYLVEIKQLQQQQQ